MSGNSLTEVNPHYLGRVVAASARHGFEASEDVYSASGIKLLGKGARIDPQTQERLILHKLKKPLEMCVAATQGVDRQHLLALAQELADGQTSFQALLEPQAVFPWLAQLHCNSATTGLLSVLAGPDDAGLRHTLLVVFIALSIGHRLGCSDSTLLTVTNAGLLHDLGEVYIDPLIDDPRRSLTQEEWRQVSAHPVIGHKLALEVCGIPLKVATAILEHHERGNGAGYPRGIFANEQTVAGQLIGVAEMMTAFADLDQPLARAELAMRIAPNEYVPPIVSAVVAAARQQKRVLAPQKDDTLDSRMSLLLLRIAKVVEMLDLDDMRTPSPPLRQLLERTQARIKMLMQIFSTVGLDACRENTACARLIEGDQGEIGFEIDAVLDEVAFRLRELARDLSLHAAHLSWTEANQLQPLITLLDGELVAEDHTARVAVAV